MLTLREKHEYEREIERLTDRVAKMKLDNKANVKRLTERLRYYRIKCKALELKLV